MRSRRFRSALALIPLLAVAAAAFWVAPTGAAPQQAGCELVGPPIGPSEPLEMNTVLQQDLFKTVVMEKEVWVCFDEQGAPQRVVDVETFIELIERLTTDAIRTVDRRVEVARCIKDLQDGTVTCSARNLTLGQANFPPLQGCSLGERQGNPTDPVEMNTVAPESGLIKTIKVEKEAFSCGDAIRDLYLFTEIIEKRTVIPGTDTPTIRPTVKRFEGIVCFKAQDQPDIDRCARFVPPRIR